MRIEIRKAIERARLKPPNIVTPRYVQPIGSRGQQGRRRDVTRDGKMACIACREPFPLTEFYVHRAGSGRNSYDSRCNGCRKKEMIVHRLGNSVEEYESLLSEARGLCAICHGSYGDRPNVDHCHKTGKIRGVLCSRCNSGIGLFLDSTQLLDAAIRYLDRSQAGAS